MVSFCGLAGSGAPVLKQGVEMIAVISDVHGNIEALERVLEAIGESGAERIVCAGDLVGYGPEPDRVVERIAAAGIACVRGNHDRWALDPGGRYASAFGYDDLAQETLEHLSALPSDLHFELEGERVAVVHGAPDWDMTFINGHEQTSAELGRFLEMAAADILVCGHTHRPLIIEVVGRGWIVNPGALLASGQALHGGGTGQGLDGTWGQLEVDPFSFEVRAVGDGSTVEASVHRVLTV